MSQKARITVYRTRGCPFCVAAEQMLEARELDFEQVYLDDHPDRRGFVENILPGHRTVPLVMVDGSPLGGFNELRAMDARGELEGLKDSEPR